MGERQQNPRFAEEIRTRLRTVTQGPRQELQRDRMAIEAGVLSLPDRSESPLGQRTHEGVPARHQPTSRRRRRVSQPHSVLVERAIVAHATDQDPATAGALLICSSAAADQHLCPKGRQWCPGRLDSNPAIRRDRTTLPTPPDRTHCRSCRVNSGSPSTCPCRNGSTGRCQCWRQNRGERSSARSSWARPQRRGHRSLGTTSVRTRAVSVPSAVAFVTVHRSSRRECSRTVPAPWPLGKYSARPFIERMSMRRPPL